MENLPGPVNWGFSKLSRDARAGVPRKSRDEMLLESLGYRQELKREFTPIETFGLSFSIIGVLPSIACALSLIYQKTLTFHFSETRSVLAYTIPNGGTSSMVWGWATGSFFLLFVSMAIAELGSAAPTVGGLYFWTFTYSSYKYRRLLSWLVGYTNTIAYIAGTASIDWCLAVQIMSLASIGSGMKFEPKTYETFAVYCAILICHALITGSATRILARMQTPYIVINILLCLGIIIGLPISTPQEYKNGAEFALSDFRNTSGWPDGYVFILSFMAPLWTIGAFDSSLHISEEAKNANLTVPRAVVGATFLGGILGWAINMAIAFNMGSDLSGLLLSEPVGQPLAVILIRSFGIRGTMAFWTFIIMAQFMMGASILTAGSRQMWAFSRDGALPYSRVLYRINSYTQTPVNCVWVVATASCFLGMLSFIGTAAIGAVFTMSITCQYFSYSVPICARLLAERRFIPGPFHLRKYSSLVAIVAVCWMAIMGVVLLFPHKPHPAPSEMNYTVIVLGGTLLFSTLYYYFPKYGGRHWFRGPVSNICVKDIATGNLTYDLGW